MVQFVYVDANDDALDGDDGRGPCASQTSMSPSVSAVDLESMRCLDDVWVLFKRVVYVWKKNVLLCL